MLLWAVLAAAPPRYKRFWPFAEVVPFTILRSSNMLGPLPPYRQGPTTVKFLQWLVTELTSGRAVNAFEDEVRSYVSVEDFAAIVHAAAVSSRCELHNQGSP